MFRIRIQAYNPNSDPDPAFFFTLTEILNILFYLIPKGAILSIFKYLDRNHNRIGIQKVIEDRSETLIGMIRIRDRKNLGAILFLRSNID